MPPLQTVRKEPTGATRARQNQGRKGPETVPARNRDPPTSGTKEKRQREAPGNRRTGRKTQRHTAAPEAFTNTPREHASFCGQAPRPPPSAEIRDIRDRQTAIGKTTGSATDASDLGVKNRHGCAGGPEREPRGPKRGPTRREARELEPHAGRRKRRSNRPKSAASAQPSRHADSEELGKGQGQQRATPRLGAGMTRRHASRNREIVRRHTRSQYRPERGIVDTITPVRSRTDAATEPPRSEVWRAPRRLRAIEALPEQRGETSPEAREQEDSRLEKPPKLDCEHRMARATPAPEKATPQSDEPKDTPTSTARWGHTRAWGTVHDAPSPHSSRTSHPEEGRRDAPPGGASDRRVHHRSAEAGTPGWRSQSLPTKPTATGETAWTLGLSPTPWTENTRRSTWRYRTGVGCRSGTGRRRHTRPEQRHSRIAPSVTRRTSSVRITRYQTPGSRAGAQQQHPGFTE